MGAEGFSSLQLLSSLSLFFISLFLFLGIGVAIFAAERRLDLCTTLTISSNVVGEFPEVVVLVVHGGRAQTKRADEFGQREGPLLHLALTELSQHVLAGP